MKAFYVLLLLLSTSCLLAQDVTTTDNNMPPANTTAIKKNNATFNLTAACTDCVGSITSHTWEVEDPPNSNTWISLSSTNDLCATNPNSATVTIGDVSNLCDFNTKTFRCVLTCSGCASPSLTTNEIEVTMASSVSAENTNNPGANITEPECDVETFSILADCPTCVGTITAYDWQVQSFPVGNFVTVPASLGNATVSGINTELMTVTIPGSGIGFAGATFRCEMTCTGCGASPLQTNNITVEFNSNPSSVTASSVLPCGGDNDPMTLSITGGTNTRYQWLDDGVEITGATGSTFQGSNSNTWQQSDHGNFSCEVTSEGCYDGTTSNNASATVDVSPTTISETETPVSICSGSSNTFIATPTNGFTSSSGFHYQWKRDGVNVGTAGTSAGFGSHMDNTAGNYSVEIRGPNCPVGTVFQIGELTVSPSATVTDTDMDNVSIGETGSGSFIVTCNNVESASSINWTLGGVSFATTAGTASFTGSTTTLSNTTFNITITNTSLNSPTNTIYTSRFDVEDATDEASGGEDYNHAVTFTVGNNSDCAGTTATVMSGSNPSFLPVELTGFKAREKARDIRLDWTTSSEVNSDYFDVERAFEEDKFVSIGKVQAAGYSSTPKSYDFLDEDIGYRSISNSVLYRLKIVDKDGKVAYSDIVEVDLSTEELLQINSIVALSEKIQLNFSTPEESASVIARLVSTNGQVLSSQKSDVQKGINQLNLDALHIPTGIYILQLTDGKNMVAKKFLR